MAEAITTTEAPISETAPTRHAKPAPLYRGGLWKFALATARAFPRPLARAFAIAACQSYRLTSPRTRIVFDNLLPAFEDDEIAAAAATRRLFSNFARKMV